MNGSFTRLGKRYRYTENQGRIGKKKGEGNMDGLNDGRRVDITGDIAFCGKVREVITNEFGFVGGIDRID